MKRQLSISLLAVVLLAGCSSGGPATHVAAGTTAGGATANQSASASTSTDTGTGTAADQACTGGVAADAPGVVSVTCDGPADIRIQAGSVAKDIHGGRCQSAGDVWSATVGVIIDATGSHGTYAGPKVDVVTVNNTATHGKGTIQATVDGKQYFNLGDATVTLSADGKTAHFSGASDRLSDAPGAKIVVDVTC